MKRQNRRWRDGDQDDIDIGTLRVDQETRAAGHQIKAEGLAAEFHQVSGDWELRLLEAKRVSTYKLATELLYRHWLDKGKSIAVTNRVAAAAKLSARSKSRALAELEQLGLITVDRTLRRSPQVVLHHMSGG